jgi:hypothetical protein
MPTGAQAAAPAAIVGRPIVTTGDSRLHGMGADDITQTIAFRIAQTTGQEVVNLANGGRRLEPRDLTIASALDPSVLLMLYDFNDFFPNDTTAQAFAAKYDQALANFRAGSTARMIVVTSFASTSDADYAPPGAYAGNSPSLEAFRQVERARVAARNDPRIRIVEGRGPGMPTAGLANSADGVHYYGTAQAAQAAVLVSAL